MPVAGLGAVGFIVGAIIGVLTRPTILGMPVPLGVLLSPHPMDAQFKAQLWQHIGLAGVAGALAFAAAGYFWSRRHG